MGLDSMRTGAWLNPGRVRAYLRVLAAANALSLLWLLVGASDGLDPQGRLLGTDFVSFWAAGVVVQAGANPYDSAVHIAAESAVWQAQQGYTAFFYPPLFLLWCAPLGLLGYFSALATWLGATGAAFMAALRFWESRLPWMALAAFPPLLITLTHGQTSFLLAALLGGGFAALAQGRASLAGVLFGLAAFKPQFGVLVPVVLLAGRQWRTIGVATLTVVGSAILATAAFGAGIWSEWQAVAAPAQDAMAGGAIGFGKMQSLFAALRLLGISTGLAYVAQGLLAVAVALALGYAAWKRGPGKEVGATALVGALLATPFVLDYDFVLLAFPLALIAHSKPRAWERTVAALAFVVPAFSRPLGVLVGIPLAPLVVVALFVLLFLRAIKEPAAR